MTNRCHALLLSTSLLLPIGSGHAQVSAPTLIQVPGSQGFVPSDDPRSYEPADSRRFFSTDAEAARQTRQQLQERLRDPQQRSSLRADTQKNLEQSHSGLAQFLRIDAAAEQQLFDLLTDQFIERDSQFLDRAAALQKGGAGGFTAASAQVEATENLHSDQIKALLGPERMERYYYYQRTRYLHGQMTEFNDRLAPADPLRVDQQQRLLELLEELDLKFWRRVLFNRPFETLGRSRFMDDAEQQKRSQQINIERNERALRAKEQAAEVALERVAQFLKPTQMQAYAQWEAEKLNRRRAFVQRLRTAAGLPPDIAEASEDEIAADRQMPGRLRLTLTVRVNGTEPETLYLAGDSGSNIPFNINTDLSAEASPTLYANGEVFVLLRLFERGQAQELPLGVMGLDSLELLSPDKDSRMSVSHAIRLHGGKHYDVTIGLEATPLPPSRDEPSL